MFFSLTVMIIVVEVVIVLKMSCLKLFENQKILFRIEILCFTFIIIFIPIMESSIYM